MPCQGVESSKAPDAPGTAQAPKTDVPRKLDKMKYQYQGVVKESKVLSNWENIGDTDVKHVDL